MKIIITINAERLLQEALCAENFSAGRASTLNETAFMRWESASSPCILFCLRLVLFYLDSLMTNNFLMELKNIILVIKCIISVYDLSSCILLSPIYPTRPPPACVATQKATLHSKSSSSSGPITLISPVTLQRRRWCRKCGRRLKPHLS